MGTKNAMEIWARRLYLLFILESKNKQTNKKLPLDIFRNLKLLEIMSSTKPRLEKDLLFTERKNSN